MSSLDIVCIGNVVVDAVGIGVQRIPEEGALALFDKVEMHMGGCANNCALALAKLGVKVGLSAKVGADGLGEYSASILSKHGVDLRGLKRSATESTSFSFIMIPESGDRRILHTLGANATFSPADVEPGLFNGVKWVSVNGLALLPALEGEALAKVLRQAKAAGARTAADTAINDRFTAKEWEALLGPSYGLLDVLFPSEVEARALTGESEPRKIVEALKKRGVKIAGVKLGERGSAILTDEGYYEIPIYPVKCTDTLGAGDCFMAGFLAGMVRGMHPREAALLGNATSAHCVQAVGATTGIPKLDAVLDFQKKHPVRAHSH